MTAAQNISRLGRNVTRVGRFVDALMIIRAGGEHRRTVKGRRDPIILAAAAPHRRHER